MKKSLLQPVQLNLIETDGEGEAREPVMRIIEKVAQAKDTEPRNLAPIHDNIDSDALDDLCTNSTALVEITFEYEGYQVRVNSEGRVTLEK